MEHRFGLPAYIHLPGNGRAYLVLSMDIQGKWNAGYHCWYESDDEYGHYLIHGPVAEKADSPDEVMKLLAQQIRQLNDPRA